MQVMHNSKERKQFMGFIQNVYTVAMNCPRNSPSNCNPMKLFSSSFEVTNKQEVILGLSKNNHR